MVEVEEVVEVVEVEEVAEGAGTEKVGEVKASKQTANMRLIVKVGQPIHLMHNLLTHPPSQILLHFLLYQLRVLKTQIVSKFNHKVRNK